MKKYLKTGNRVEIPGKYVNNFGETVFLRKFMGTVPPWRGQSQKLMLIEPLVARQHQKIERKNLDQPFLQKK